MARPLGNLPEGYLTSQHPLLGCGALGRLDGAAKKNFAACDFVF
jgi:hypothetical protein